jgi:hypothetical protein
VLLFEHRDHLASVADQEEVSERLDHISEVVLRAYYPSVQRLELAEVASDGARPERPEAETGDSDGTVAELEKLLGVLVDLDDGPGPSGSVTALSTATEAGIPLQ